MKESILLKEENSKNRSKATIKRRLLEILEWHLKRMGNNLSLSKWCILK